ncbi:MAG TPA: folylpolyglutamate synthase/dihydrofolate synthase family protein [Mucilaginibacter sp.]|nr:folylpolyglutamate synthase/dihydrofolate synthase family protein [Mucilaginibacter sp.]
MNYEETIHYLYSQLPLFTRDGVSAYKADLTNTIELLSRLDNPHNRFKSIHVGGTNGKGSTSHMLAAILQTAGYKTGLYTSPHLKDFRERIRINGQMISEQQVVNFVAQHRTDFEAIHPSFFEMTVALAFDVFAKERVDIAVVEVGLGGRLDSTNVINPLLSVITNIGWDHMNILGDTLKLIAAEKAGIIKTGVPVIIGEYQQEVAEIFEQKARAVSAKISFASALLHSEMTEKETEINSIVKPGIGESINVKITPATTETVFSPQQLTIDLTGSYQLKNIKAVLCAVEELRAQGFAISDEHIETALSQVKQLTGLRGRWEVLSRQPLTICDTGHNPEGMEQVLQNIAGIAYRKLHFVLGMVNDKDISKILTILPVNAHYYFCRPDIPRGLDATNLWLKAEGFGLRGEAYPSVKDALSAAQLHATEDDLVFVGGSTFVVAEVV